MVLRIDVGQAMDIIPPVGNDVPRDLEIGNSLPTQINETQDEGSSIARLESEIATEPTEGILHILTKD